MLNKLIKKKNLILIFYAFVLVTFLILTLIFGNSEDKFEILIGSLILPFVIYGFLRLTYKIVNINSPFKAMCFFYYFFLINGLLGTVMFFSEFINAFPNGLSPTFGCCVALVIASLDSAKKSIETKEKSQKI